MLIDYNYGRHMQYVGKESVANFWKVSGLELDADVQIADEKPL